MLGLMIKTRTARQKIYAYCDEKERAGESVSLIALSAHIDDQNPDAFSSYVRDNGYEINETFRPHKATYTKFKRISRAFGSVKVSFDVQDLDNGGVDYDDDNNCLVIKRLPQDLIDEIKKHRSPANESVTD